MSSNKRLSLKDFNSSKNWLLKTEQSIRVICLMKCVMDLESKYGLIMQNMRVNGEKIKPMEEESSGMLTVISMKVSGRTTKPTATESISM